jgi:hypothetical protein
MNKDFDLKKDPEYDSSRLRRRIDKSTKPVHDDTAELDMPQSKTLPIIPVTGIGIPHKYLNNKSHRAY